MTMTDLIWRVNVSNRTVRLGLPRELARAPVERPGVVLSHQNARCGDERVSAAGVFI
jgi:hypothetical protein